MQPEKGWAHYPLTDALIQTASPDGGQLPLQIPVPAQTMFQADSVLCDQTTWVHVLSVLSFSCCSPVPTRAPGWQLCGSSLAVFLYV